MDEVEICQTQTDEVTKGKYSSREWPSVKISTNYCKYFISGSLTLFLKSPLQTNFRKDIRVQG